MSVTLPGTGAAVETLSAAGGNRQVVTIAPNDLTSGDSIGPLTETAPATDTASSGLNGRLQRLAQRLTALIGLLPSALGAGGGLKIDGSGVALPVISSGTPVQTFNVAANSTVTLTLPAVVGKTNYLQGLWITGTGATAANAVLCNITGVAAGAPTYFLVGVPAGNTAAVQLLWTFPQPLVGSAPNTPIVVTLPAFGPGNVYQAMTIFGSYQ